MIESIEQVFSINTPDLECYATLKQPQEHFAKKLFVIEGDKVVRRFLDTSLILVSVLFSQKWFEVFKDALQERPEPIKVFLADLTHMANIVGYQYHHGVMAVAKLPHTVTLDVAVTTPSSTHLIVALDKLDNAENIGVLVRNCAACGVSAILVGETCADPYLRRAVRNSMGTVFRVPIVRTSSLRESLLILRSNYTFQIIAAHPHDPSVSLYQTKFSKNTCIVFGSEGDGISPEILATCDTAVTIPMALSIDSLNVACASAIMLYEVNRQHAQNN